MQLKPSDRILRKNMITIPRDKIAVTPIFDPDMSRGGIIIPDSAKDRCDQGIVKYIGKNVDSAFIKPGDYVFFSGYTGTLFIIEGEGKLIILPEKFVIARLESEELDTITVPGLYLKGNWVDGLASNEFGEAPYYPAPFSAVANLLAQSVTDSGFKYKLKVTVPKPDVEDYDD